MTQECYRCGEKLVEYKCQIKCFNCGYALTCNDA